ncbi:MAG: hypothetical protein IPO18_08310 [bacterium]|nr:hypothetical protein [bacterium]MBK9472276.1 hypothetical protein [bacterium]
MLERKTDTPESAAFWARVERVKAGINEWPEWRRRLMEIDPPLGRSGNDDDTLRDTRSGGSK